MKLADLSPDIIARIKTLRYDRIIEKHEGPEDWKYPIEHYGTEFFDFEGHWVLLPVSDNQLANITLLRLIRSEDGNVLTLFLNDTTYYTESDMAMFYTGFLAICEKMPSTDFYIATVYHEWFIVDNAALKP